MSTPCDHPRAENAIPLRAGKNTLRGHLRDKMGLDMQTFKPRSCINGNDRGWQRPSDIWYRRESTFVQTIEKNKITINSAISAEHCMQAS